MSERFDTLVQDLLALHAYLQQPQPDPNHVLETMQQLLPVILADRADLLYTILTIPDPAILNALDEDVLATFRAELEELAEVTPVIRTVSMK